MLSTKNCNKVRQRKTTFYCGIVKNESAADEILTTEFQCEPTFIKLDSTFFLDLE